MVILAEISERSLKLASTLEFKLFIVDLLPFYEINCKLIPDYQPPFSHRSVTQEKPWASRPASYFSPSPISPIPNPHPTLHPPHPPIHHPANPPLPNPLDRRSRPHKHRPIPQHIGATSRPPATVAAATAADAAPRLAHALTDLSTDPTASDRARRHNAPRGRRQRRALDGEVTKGRLRRDGQGSVERRSRGRGARGPECGFVGARGERRGGGGEVVGRC